MPVEQGLPWHPVATGLAGQAIPFIVAASHAHALPSAPFWFPVPAVLVASPALPPPPPPHTQDFGGALWPPLHDKILTYRPKAAFDPRQIRHDLRAADGATSRNGSVVDPAMDTSLSKSARARAWDGGLRLHRQNKMLH